jgi:Asp-tRNA(Asn)/Glu-tRNA(Gln) amidotransferase A subunit family amidase
MEQTLTQPAAAAAAMIRNKKVSSRELTELVLDRVDTVNATLNAVVELVRPGRPARCGDPLMLRPRDLLMAGRAALISCFA